MNEFFMDQEAKRLKWSIYFIQRSKELTNFQQLKSSSKNATEETIYHNLFILLYVYYMFICLFYY